MVWRNSVTLWTDAIQSGQRSYLPYYNRGNAYLTQGDYLKAVKDYDKALTFHPYYGMAYNNRANAYALMGNTDKALHDYDEAIKFDPYYAESYYNKALLCFFLRGEYREAWKSALQAVTLGHRVSPQLLQAIKERLPQAKGETPVLPR